MGRSSEVVNYGEGDSREGLFFGWIFRFSRISDVNTTFLAAEPFCDFLAIKNPQICKSLLVKPTPNLSKNSGFLMS